jgi:nicotinamidase-related amidase
MPLTAHEDCLLIVVDAQPGFYPAELPAGDRALAAQALERATWLVALARELEVPMVVTEEEPERNGRTDPAILTRIGAATPVLTKPTFGLAGTPEILHAVRATGRGTAVLVGYETDVCVLQSAVGLLDAGLRAVVAEDATFSPGEMHDRGLARLREAGASLTHCKALAYEWVRTVARANELLGSGVLGPPPFRL